MTKLYEMNDVEQQLVDAFLAREDVKHVLSTGEFALVFSRQSGIGVSITASAKSKDGTIISDCVTDYGSW